LNIKIYMLGTGAAVPVNRALPCIACRVDSDIYLLDVGEGCQYRMMKLGLGVVKVKAVFITHMHGDHYLGLFGLLQSMRLLNKESELHIVAPQDLIDLIKYLVENKLVKIEHDIHLQPIGEGEVYRDNKVVVSSYVVEHNIPSWGYVVEACGRRIVYTGDTTPSENTVANSKDADLLIHESTFISLDREEAIKQGHSTAADAALVASKAGVKRLLLTHISSRYSDPDVLYYDAYRYFKNVVVAMDNMIIYL